MQRIWIFSQESVLPGYASGSGLRHFYLAEQFIKRGFSAKLIFAKHHHLMRTNTLKVGSSVPFFLVPTFQYRHANSKLRILNWIIYSFYVMLMTVFFVRKNDIVLYSSPPPVAIVSFLSIRWIKKFKLIFEVRDIWPLSLIEIGNYDKNSLAIRGFSIIEKLSYKNSDHVVSNLKYLPRHSRNVGVDIDEYFTWIPNGQRFKEVVEHKFGYDCDVNDNLKSNNIISVIYAGTVGKANNLEILIETATVLRQNASINFTIMGQGPELEGLQQLVKTRQLKNVSFKSAIPADQVSQELRKYDVCYLGLKPVPTFKFGVSPNKLFDYMQAAKPILYAVESGDYDPVTEIEAGIKCDPDDPEKIADALLCFLDMGVKARSAMGERGRRYAYMNHNYESLSKKYIEVFKSL